MERFRYLLSEYDIVYYAMTYCFGDIRAWSRTILLNFVELSHYLFSYLNRKYLMNGGSEPYKPYHFPKDCIENFRMQILNLL